VPRFQGFAAVGNALSPEKAQHYRNQLPPGTDPPPAPVMYVHGTADHTFRPPATLLEVSIDTTQPAFTVKEMLARNGIPTGGPAATTLVPGSVEKGQLHLCYEPQISLTSGRICCLEALVRWRHPTRGEVPPGEFIPLPKRPG
jgi:hypothetical protein